VQDISDEGCFLLSFSPSFSSLFNNNLKKALG